MPNSRSMAGVLTNDSKARFGARMGLFLVLTALLLALATPALALVELGSEDNPDSAPLEFNIAEGTRAGGFIWGDDLTGADTAGQ